MTITASEPDSQSRLKQALLALKKVRKELDRLQQAGAEPIAITGMGCRFPGNVQTPEDFWELLQRGGDGITEVPPDRWDAAALYDPDPDAPGKMYTRYGGFFGNTDMFDAWFFGISPKEAVLLDPQQRVLLEVCWEALEYAGTDPSSLRGLRGGVFVGICNYDYSRLMGNKVNDPYMATGNTFSVAAGRISYFLGLKGPCLALDTACSSSLMSVHLACQSLRAGECDLALAGGVNRILAPEISINFCKARMLSPNGRCKTFDAAADGYVRSEGCGMVVLKRLSDAQAHGDRILAVIRGSAVNQDGRTSGLTVPHGPSQQDVIRRALENAGVSPHEISYIEAHGTGTALGDPIEMGALGAIFAKDRAPEHPLVVGSVKTNIGHMEGAAGVAGLMKLVLCLQHGQIPPHLHFNTPSPHIPWEHLPVEIPTALRSWPTENRLAGVSSFGFSGVNAHVVVAAAESAEARNREQAAPAHQQLRPGDRRPLHLLVLSAKTSEALRELAGAYASHLRRPVATALGDICFTASTGRGHFDQRLAVIAASADQMAALLESFAANQTVAPGLRYGCEPLTPETAPASADAEVTRPPSGADTTLEWKTFLEHIGEQYLRGIAVDWPAFYKDAACRKVGLPGYPFQRKRYWIESAILNQGEPNMEQIVGAQQPASETRQAEITQSPGKQIMTAVGPSSRELLHRLLTGIIQEVSGLEPALVTPNQNYFEMGLDSLMLVRLREGIQKELGIEIRMDQFYEEADTPHKTVELILKLTPQIRMEKLHGAEPDLAGSTAARPEEAVPEAKGVASPPVEIPAAGLSEQMAALAESIGKIPDSQAPAAVGGSVEYLMAQQLRSLSELTQGITGLMTRQMDFLQKAAQPASPPGRPPTNDRSQPATQPETTGQVSSVRASSAPAPAGEPGAAISLPVVTTPPPGLNFRSMKFEPESLTPSQQAFVEALIFRYTARTPRSRALIGNARAMLADWIHSLCFRLSLKEIIYPITAAAANGAWIEDVDGNRYVDVAMGYGVSFLGNRPPFVIEAIQAQLQHGYELGPQWQLTTDVTRLIVGLTGVERVTFCNTGSEAVMVALRLARAVTGRPKIALFAGAYHGTFDGVLAVRSEAGVHPIGPGTPPGMIADTLVLNYGMPDALETIRQHGSELAAILVEPVQSRRPDFQPRAFLQQLRSLTQELDIALIFDEVITGFRIHPGGAQAWFGVTADLVTYGKIAGGGMPIGIVAGRARFMDAIDGGLWYYGDNSVPNKEVTFFAGTFCKHPLTMAAARAALEHLQQHGQALQQALNEKTSRLALRLNRFFEAENVALRVNHFASVFRFESFGKYHLALEPLEMELFFLMLLEKGIYTWERRICFLSTVHQAEDLEKIYTAVTETIQELRQGGFTLEAHPTAPSRLGAPARRDAAFPAQQRLFVLSQYADGARTYNMVMALQVLGDLDIDRLERAFQEMLRRHDSLRTAFAWQDDVLQQQVWSAVPFRLDYADVAPENLDAFLENLDRPFDLTRPPLLRVGVARLALARHIVSIVTHHTVFDGPSLDILLQEVSALYNGGSLRPLRRRYADFVSWHQQLMASADLQRQKAFWQQLFADENTEGAAGVPVLNLPLDFLRPARQTFAGDVVRATLDASHLERLKKLARRNGVTLNMLLLGAWQVLLQRLSGQDDFCVGFPSAGYREREDFGDILGMFANTTVMRCRPRPESPFKELLSRVKQDLLNVFAHADVPFEELVQQLAPQRDQARNPLFDTMFVYEKAVQRELVSPNLAVTPYFQNRSIAMVDLTLEAIETEDSLLLSLEYATSLFRRDTLERWMVYFQRILEHVQTDAQVRLKDIDLLPPRERQQLLYDFNATAYAFPQDATIVSLFAAQAAATPHQIALLHVDASSLAGDLPARASVGITYRELYQQVLQLARILTRRHDIGNEAPVAVCMARGPQMVLAMLGIMQAGGAWLPIDTNYPAARVRHIVQDSGCRLILTSAAHKARFAELQGDGSGPAVVDLAQWHLADADSAVSLRKPAPENLAYIIYTSGSTGMPKGVMIGHRGFVNMIRYQIEDLGIGTSDRVLQFMSPGFDVSMSEFFMTLLSGATLITADETVLRDQQQLKACLARQQVTILTLPPVFLASLEPDVLEPVRTLITIGEPAVARDAVFYGRSKRYINTYGPTEATVYITQYTIDPHKTYSGDIPIGKPIGNSEALVLDNWMQPVPIGVWGDLWLGGVQLARGYINRPELNAARFVPHPFKPDQRLYQSGDLARWRADGNLEFRGRIDHQVKIRGHRVEPGEIENCLLQHPAIDNTIVRVHREAGRNAELVAYIIVNRPDLTVSDLRAWLQQYLPEYMVPTWFVPIEAFPTNASGKIDAARLPAPQSAALARGTSCEAPRNPIEQQLLQVWQEVLNQPAISIHDNYFALGGDSIKAIGILARLRRLNLTIKLADLFQYPTIAGLAERVSGQATDTESVVADDIQTEIAQTDLDLIHALAEVRRAGVEAVYPLTPMQEGMLFQIRYTEDRLTNFIQVTFPIRQTLNVTRFKACWREILERHVVLRSLFSYENLTQPLQVVLRHPELVFHYENLADRPATEDREQYIQEWKARDRARAFDLRREIPLRISLLQRGAASYEFIFSTHHIVIDGWSAAIIFREFFELYTARDGSRSDPVRPLEAPAPYARYLNWLQQQNRRDASRFWQYYLQGYTRPAGFGAPRRDSEPSASATFLPRRCTLVLDSRDAQVLRQTAAACKTTLHTLLQAAWGLVLARYNDTRDVVFGSVVSGRPEAVPDIEGIVGLFINTIPVRVTLQPDDTLLTLAARLQAESLAAKPYHYYPLADIQALSPLKHDLLNHLTVLQNYPVAQTLKEDLARFVHSDYVGQMEDYDYGNHDLSVTFVPEDCLTCEFSYNGNVYPEAFIQQLGAHFVRVLKALAQMPDQPLRSIEMLSATEKEAQMHQEAPSPSNGMDAEFDF